MENFKFKKRYGQNFLTDKNILDKIVNDIDVLSNSLVIEIGCGSGNLTKVLCEKFDRVLGYEIDSELKGELDKALSDYKNYEIIFDDILKRDVLRDVAPYDSEHVYVIANLPYYITTPIVTMLTDLGVDFEVLRFMVQKEVGDRFCADIGSKNYSSLSVYLNYNYVVKKNFVVSRNCFYPKPNVDSLIVSFYKRENKLFVKDKELFYKLLRDSFRYKRKTLRNNLREYDLEKVSKTLEKYDMTLSCRAEQISTEIFCEISNDISI